MFSSRRYKVELGAALLLYLILLLAMNMIDRHLQPIGTARIMLALLPMIGCAAALLVIMRAIRRMDELQRRIQFEAIAFAFAATALLTFGWGFLEDAGLPHLRAFAVWPLMGTTWAIGMAFARRRY